MWPQASVACAGVDGRSVAADAVCVRVDDDGDDGADDGDDGAGVAASGSASTAPTLVSSHCGASASSVSKGENSHVYD